jgi:hypothetical protein
MNLLFSDRPSNRVTIDRTHGLLTEGTDKKYTKAQLNALGLRPDVLEARVGAAVDVVRALGRGEARPPIRTIIRMQSRPKRTTKASGPGDMKLLMDMNKAIWWVPKKSSVKMAEITPTNE